MTDFDGAPTNNAELLEYMTHYWNGFVSASDAVPDDAWLTSVDAEGWTIRDHVSHVVVWVVGEVELFATGTPIRETLGIPDEVWTSEDPDAVNRWIRQSRMNATPAELRAERDQVFPKLIAVVAGMSESDLAQPARVSGLEDSDRPLLLVISEYCGLHYDDHREQIERLAAAGS